VGQQAGLVRDGKLPRVDRALFSDAVGTTVGAAMGTSTITCYIESAAGVSDGARTGLASVVTALLLAASLFFSPLASMVGGGVKVGQAVLYPTLAPALIVVGSMMLKTLRELKWDDPTEYLPSSCWWEFRSPSALRTASPSGSSPTPSPSSPPAAGASAPRSPTSSPRSSWCSS
jgi:AGZA family xanthine/uracil permease-like MFS transporter